VRQPIVVGVSHSTVASAGYYPQRLYISTLACLADATDATDANLHTHSKMPFSYCPLLTGLFRDGQPEYATAFLPAPVAKLDRNADCAECRRQVAQGIAECTAVLGPARLLDHFFSAQCGQCSQ
jgi:hypothetical protein